MHELRERAVEHGELATCAHECLHVALERDHLVHLRILHRPPQRQIHTREGSTAPVSSETARLGQPDVAVFSKTQLISAFHAIVRGGWSSVPTTVVRIDAACVDSIVGDQESSDAPRPKNTTTTTTRPTERARENA